MKFSYLAVFATAFAISVNLARLVGGSEFANFLILALVLQVPLLGAMTRMSLEEAANKVRGYLQD